MTGQIGPAHRNADSIITFGEGAHNMAAEESGTSDDGDQFFTELSHF